jgi:hypothetical protein
MKTITLKCSGCDIYFEKQYKEYNRRVKKGVEKFYCSNKCGAIAAQSSKRAIAIFKKCLGCGNDFETNTKKRSKTCCSKKCASRYSRNFKITDDFRKKCSIGMKKVWQNPEYYIKAVDRMSKSKRFNSKGEIEIREYLKNKFPFDFWTFGPCRIDDRTIVRDMFSEKLKVCIEYDGIWHFKDIYGQLKDKQEKDLLLEKWCKLNGYRLIRIKEDIYKSDKNFWLEKLENAIYHSNENFVKFY